MKRPGRLKPANQGLVISLVQLKLPVVNTPTDLAAQTQRICSMIANVRRRNRNTQLVMFPEYSLHGLSMNTNPLLMCRRDGAEVTAFRAACREHHIWGCFSFMEHNSHGQPFNAAVLIDDTGEIRIHYRKLHPWVPVEPWQPGNLGVPICDGPNGSRLGITICNDAMFPETARECARKGANVMLRISGYTAPIRQTWRISNQANSMYNLMATASVSLADGPSMMNSKGAAMIVNFDGESLAEGNGLADEVVTAEVRPDVIDAARLSSGVEDNIYQLGHRGYIGIRGGVNDWTFADAGENVERRYLLPWEDRLRIEGDMPSDAQKRVERRHGGTRR